MDSSSAKEALALSEELLADLELSRLPLANCFMKGCRLSRLIGDFEMLKIFRWEIEGYPTTSKGFSGDVWDAAVKANRHYQEKDKKTDVVKDYCYSESIEALETMKSSAETRLKLTELKSVSVSSANPNQYVSAPVAHQPERNSAQKAINRQPRKFLNVVRFFIAMSWQGIASCVFHRLHRTFFRFTASNLTMP